ncbi:MAG: cytochrome c family protein [Phycisphaerae bacterium]|nr:cytochrome c family protein [Phycisphaerae bacterium]MDW8261540.1 cytochrome c3 family protein [Phycisphaerales bacterium]
MSATTRKRFLFPRWANYALPALIVMVLGGALYVPTVVTFGFSTYTTDVGYAPIQPIPYSHALHAGELGIDCRYCHSTVEKAGFAAIPSTQVCMNCHTNIRSTSEKLKPLMESWQTGKPIEWVKVHDLPDYAYFNHSAHVNAGVGCVSCHGRVDTMEVVYQAERLSMSWCIDCHRNPEKHLRPRDQVTNMKYQPEIREGETLEAAQLRVGRELKEKYRIHDEQYMIACSTCHR